MRGHILVEACIGHADDAARACQAGADRLELSAALELDGLTPLVETVAAVRAAVRVPLIVMVRPRGGDFVYSGAEVAEMCAYITSVRSQDPTGLALGALTGSGGVDISACRRLADVGRGLSLVFHRAFDQLRDPLRGIEEAIDLGFARILTSGGARTALDGADTIRRWQDHARGRIEFLPAGGIRAHNVVEVVRRTGCSQVHGAFRRAADAHEPAEYQAGLLSGGRPVRLDADELLRTRRALADSSEAV